MDFSPLGSSAFYGTDQIASNIYLNSGASYDAIMTGAKIRQRASPIYSDEIDRLQKAKASKLEKPPLPKDTFTTAIHRRPAPRESFPIMMNPEMGMDNTSSDMTVLVVVAIILVIMLVAICKSVYKACREINTLAIMMLNIKVKEKDSPPSTSQPSAPATATSVAPPGLMSSVVSSPSQIAMEQQRQQQMLQQQQLALQQQQQYNQQQQQHQQQQYNQQYLQAPTVSFATQPT